MIDLSEVLPSPLPFALWNDIRDRLKKGKHELCLLSIPAINPIVSGGYSPIGCIALTGKPEKFTRLYKLIREKVPLEPIDISYSSQRPATEAERELLGVTEMPIEINFGDGRHRYTLLREHKWRSIFACIPKRQVDWFSQFLCTENADCVLVKNPAGD